MFSFCLSKFTEFVKLTTGFGYNNANFKERFECDIVFVSEMFYTFVPTVILPYSGSLSEKYLCALLPGLVLVFLQTGNRFYTCYSSICTYCSNSPSNSVTNVVIEASNVVAEQENIIVNL